jgi:BirA family biotin operon repressor/biotin-[acetyl-CoA-carboxylase] ligase
LYPYLAGISAALAIEEKIGLKPTFKWPNDLLFNEKKFCGILSEVEFIERKVNFIILGIGINIDQKLSDFDSALKNSATSLRLESKIKIDRVALLAEILNVFERYYYFANEYGFETITTLWKKRCPRLGQQIEIIQDIHTLTGLFEDLDEDGCLLLRKKEGNLIKVVAGDFY